MLLLRGSSLFPSFLSRHTHTHTSIAQAKKMKMKEGKIWRLSRTNLQLQPNIPELKRTLSTPVDIQMLQVQLIRVQELESTQSISQESLLNARREDERRHSAGVEELGRGVEG